MRFNKLDLNLLVALDALLRERSITNAAKKLHLSAAALSSALARLRAYFDDELLVQVGRKMEITPRASSLQYLVRDVLMRVETTITTHPTFEPDKTDRTFRIFASDYTQIVLGPYLMTIVAEQKCNAQLEFLPQIADPHRELERGEADLLVIPSGFTSSDHPTELIYEEDFVCVVWRESLLSQRPLDFDAYVQADHVTMRPPGSIDAFETRFIQRPDIVRRNAVVTFSFAALPALVVGTDLVATLHARLAHRLATAWPLEIRAMPMPFERMRQVVQWHQYRSQDPGLIWLRALFAEAARRMAAANTTG